jgi:hypothetical protein
MAKSLQENLQNTNDTAVDHAVWMVWLHFFVAGAHGMTHLTLGVPLALWQMAFVGIVIVAMPVVGAMMMRKGDVGKGAGLVTITMFMSLVFGILFHFILNTPDNIAVIPSSPWAVYFIGTSYLVFLTELAGTMLGLRVWRRATKA